MSNESVKKMNSGLNIAGNSLQKRLDVINENIDKHCNIFWL